MPWIREHAPTAACIVALLLWLLWLPGLGADPAQRLTVFTEKGSFAVEVYVVSGRDYVDVGALLSGFGPVQQRKRGDRLQFRLGRAELTLSLNSARVTAGGRDLQLPAPVEVHEGRTLVPVGSLAELLGAMLGERVDYHAVSERLFVGESAVRFAAQMNPGGSELVLNFSARVDPRISAEGGRLRLRFANDGVTSPAENWNFGGPLISKLAYDETAAGPEMVVSGSQPLLAMFSNGGKTITIGAAPGSPSRAAFAGDGVVTPGSTPPQASAAAQTQAPTPAANPATPAVNASTGNASPPSAATTAAVAPAASTARNLIVLDAAHGGDETGAALATNLAEKDVTLAIALKLRDDLAQRGIPVYLLRSSDSGMSLDERAQKANALHPALYLAIHAGTLGRGMRIYDCALRPQNGDPPLFQPWDTAQAAYVQRSAQMGATLVAQLNQQSLGFPVALLPAPVRPLNSVTSAALGVEVSPLNDDAATLADANYQQTIAAALAGALAGVNPQAAP